VGAGLAHALRRPLRPLPGPLLTGLAAAYCAATVLFVGLWLYSARQQPLVELGFSLESLPGTSALRVTSVRPGSEAEGRGLRAGDRLIAVNGSPPFGLEPFPRARPGEGAVLTVRRPGSAQPLTVTATLQPRRARNPPGVAEAVATELILCYPVPFAVVGLVVLFLRRDDRNAWLLALLFGGFIAGAPSFFWRAPPALQGFVLAYDTVFYGLTPAVFYAFFAAFPARSFVDRRLPWLRPALLAAAALVTVPLGIAVLVAGGTAPLWWVARRVGRAGEVAGGLYALGAFVLGFASLVANAFTAPPEARRKTRVIVWGTLIGFLPGFVLQLVANTLDKPIYEFPFWVWGPSVLALLLMPLSFAYAVLKHRVLDVPVLLKRSARYILVQRAFLLFTLLLGVGATMAFASTFARIEGSRPELASAGLVAGVGFGIVLVAAGIQIERRVARRIDRAFFRSAYDARQILEDLAQSARRATDRAGLAELLAGHLREALQPRRLAVYLVDGTGQFVAHAGDPPPGLDRLPAGLAALERLVDRAEPWEVPPQPPALGGLEALEPECLVPIPARSGRLSGLVVLGGRRSEEPYSREDKRLLSSVASQAAIALDNIALAEEMAERMEAERRALHEMEIAKQVQSKLFPQKIPALRTLDYAGRCTQARAVGGDYYDFLDLGPGRVGLVLADIAGKGISAALLMANLQANLRSQYAVALEDLGTLLRSVNRLFFDSTELNRYATLFFGDYDDATRRLRYVNCGHNPPLLLRADGCLQHLAPTTTVLGLFDDWEAPVAEEELRPGDVLLVYSDGATEALSDAGEEFGEARLADALRAHRELAAAAIVSVLTDRVVEFSGTEQEDDLTLVVAKARG
jgi:sigma-B regulation protein RsbU (phosphoserine phosphatase)